MKRGPTVKISWQRKLGPKSASWFCLLASKTSEQQTVGGARISCAGSRPVLHATAHRELEPASQAVYGHPLQLAGFRHHGADCRVLVTLPCHAEYSTLRPAVPFYLASCAANKTPAPRLGHRPLCCPRVAASCRWILPFEGLPIGPAMQPFNFRQGVAHPWAKGVSRWETCMHMVLPWLRDLHGQRFEVR